jgi:[ribosomal protein S5]-alanine N-acetyltransferase
MREVSPTGRHPCWRGQHGYCQSDAVNEDRARDAPRFVVPDPPLTDGVVSLVPFSDMHVDALERAARDPEIARRFDKPHDSPAQQVAHLRERWREGTVASFAICDPTGRCVGGAALEAGPVRRVDAGYWLLPEARGKGLATRTLARLSRWALVDLGFERVQLWTEPDNVPSQRVANRCGFQREGVLRSYSEINGRRCDAVIYSLIRSDLRA